MPQQYFYFLISLLLLSCQNTSTETKDLSAFEVVDPGAVGLLEDSLEQIDGLILKHIDSQNIAGGVALVSKNDQVAYLKAFGFSDSEKTDSLQTDDIFRIASMTKPITTTAIMQLYEQGKLDVNDPVSDYIPEFSSSVVVETFDEADSSYTSRPASRAITLHHLLTHTSGLSYGAFFPKAGAIYTQFGITEAWTKDSVLLKDNAKIFARLPLMHDPGANWTYSTSIDVLGRVVEVVSGQPLDTYFQENILGPLDMNDTYFYLPESKYDRLVDVWFSPEVGRDGGLNVSQVNYPVSGAKTYFSGGAGLSSTVGDYYRFTRALLNGGAWDGKRILKPETVDMMTTNQIDTLSLSPGEQFGYGFSVYTEDGPHGRKVGRFSWGGYWQTLFWIDPSRDLIGMLYTNAYGTPGWGELQTDFERMVNGAVVE